MRLLLCLLLAACAGRAAGPTLPTADSAPYWVSADAEHKLSPYVIHQWRDLGLPRRGYTPAILTIEGDVAAASDALAGFGAAYVLPVTTSPATDGTLHARETDAPSRQLFAMLPNEALRFVVIAPWVIRIDGANSHPAGPQLPDDVARKLAPELYMALGATGCDRPYAVGGIADARGCLSEDQRRQLRGLGVIVGSSVANRSCEYTIFTFDIPLSHLVALASLPWITQLEGARKMDVELHDEPARDGRAQTAFVQSIASVMPGEVTPAPRSAPASNGWLTPSRH